MQTLFRRLLPVFLPILFVASLHAATYTVSNTNNSGSGSLRQAILDANANAGADTIAFNITTATRTIIPTSPLTNLTEAVTIDGATQPGFSNAPVVELSGASAGASDVDGLRISAGGCVIRALAINRFSGDGIRITNGIGSRVEGCYLGLGTDGVTRRGNLGAGVRIGLYSGANTGTNTIGGAATTNQNLISANGYGIYIEESPANVVIGNRIGTDLTGTLDRGNTNSGIYVYGAKAAFNTIGGTNISERNLISGNGEYYFSYYADGISLGYCWSNSVLGNFIGVDAAGAAPIPNGRHGVNVLYGGGNHFIGGNIAGAGNLISGNIENGVNIQNDSGGGGEGRSSAPTSFSYEGNLVQGNLIGTDAAGMTAIPNEQNGVAIGYSQGNLIGGAATGERNVISGNQQNGVQLFYNGANSNSICGNFIGITLTNALPLGNDGNGVIIASPENLIGGTNASDANVIAHNGGSGVYVEYNGTNVAILGNTIYSNSYLGIELPYGVVPNDTGDGDTGGNNLQNYPMLGQPIKYATTTVISGSLNSAALTTFRIELFDNDARDATGYGEGQSFLGALDVTTDGGGNVSFTYTNATSLPLTHFISATATDPDGNTSEFSAARRVVSPDSVDLSVTKAVSGDPVPRATNFTYSLTVTNFGPTNASSVVVTDALPAGVSFVSATTSQGTVSNIAGVITGNIGSLANGSGASMQITVSGIATGLVTNSVFASASESENDPDNNTATVPTFIGIADVTVRITDSPDPVTAGQTVTYTVAVTNAGPDAATGTILNFYVDSGSIPTGASLSQGSFVQYGNYFSCSPGTVSVGGIVTLTVTAIPFTVGSSFQTADVAIQESDPTTSDHYTNESTTVTNGPGVVEFTTDLLSVSESIGNAQVTVQRLGGALGTVTVDFATSNLTATAGSDYTATNGTLTFTNGETMKTFPVAITGDAAPECNENLHLRLTNPTGGAIILRNTNATLFIFDDEITPVGTLRAASLAVSNHVTTGNSSSYQPSISADGLLVAYASYASDLSRTSDRNNNSDIYLHDRSGGTNRMVSVNTNGVAANAYSVQPVISADGGRVAFLSYAGDLVTNTTSGNQQLFVRTLAAGGNTLVSVNTNGAGCNGYIYTDTVSTNGSKIAFQTFASDLVPGDANGTADIFLRDLAASTNRLVSVNTAGTASANNYSYTPTVSGDGNYVAFVSYASNIAANDANTRPDVFRRDLAAGTTALVSVNTSGNAGNSSCGDNLAISDDGRYVAFESYSSDLVPGGSPSFTREIFRRDLTVGTNIVISVNNSNVAANGYSTLQGMSADGRYVLFITDANNLAGSDTNFASDIYVRDTVAGTTTLISADASGTNTGSGYSTYSFLSRDGRYVSFISNATNLVAATRQPGIADVFLRDLAGNTTTLLTTRYGDTNFGGNGTAYYSVVSTNGVAAFPSSASDLTELDGNGGDDIFARAPGDTAPTLLSISLSATGNGYSSDQRITPDGTKVVFNGNARNLVLNDANYDNDIFLRNLTNNNTTLISVNAAGTTSGNGSSGEPRLSADGRYVAFSSSASDLVAGDVNSDNDIFLRDTGSNTTALISVKNTGSGSGNGGSGDPEITPDGKFIVFQSYASNLTTNDSNGATSDIFIRNRTNSVAELVSVTPAGTASGNGDSYNPVMSDDGRYVAFETFASNLGPTDGNNAYDVYVRDRQTGTNILCSRNLTGTSGGDSGSYTAQITPDGRYITYASDASDLVALSDTNATTDIFVFDVVTRSNRLVSVNSSGTGSGNGYSYNPFISADGRYVAFESVATNLVANDSNGDLTDIFVRDLVSDTTTLISVNCAGTGSGDNLSFAPQISADGRYVTFMSYAWNLSPGTYSLYVSQIFRRDLQTGETILISRNRADTGGGDNYSFTPLFSAAGNTIAFTSAANDLITDDGNNANDVFVWNSGVVATAVNLVLNKTASAGSVVEFSPLTYTLAVTNLGNLAASSTVVTDTLPANLSFVSATTSTGTVTNIAGIVTANLGTLGISAGATITITVTPTNSGIITNFAFASATEMDAAPANNTSSAIVTVTPFPPPRLYTLRTNSQMLILWPSNTPPVFALESKTNLQPAVTWSPVTNAVATLGTNNAVTLSPDLSERTRFFRLRR